MFQEEHVDTKSTTQSTSAICRGNGMEIFVVWLMSSTLILVASAIHTGPSCYSWYIILYRRLVFTVLQMVALHWCQCGSTSNINNIAVDALSFYLVPTRNFLKILKSIICQS